MENGPAGSLIYHSYLLSEAGWWNRPIAIPSLDHVDLFSFWWLERLELDWTTPSGIHQTCQTWEFQMIGSIGSTFTYRGFLKWGIRSSMTWMIRGYPNVGHPTDGRFRRPGDVAWIPCYDNFFPCSAKTAAAMTTPRCQHITYVNDWIFKKWLHFSSISEETSIDLKTFPWHGIGPRASSHFHWFSVAHAFVPSAHIWKASPGFPMSKILVSRSWKVGYRLSTGWWWLEPWNFMIFYISWEFHHPNWRSPWFFRGLKLYHQPVIIGDDYKL